MEAKPDKYRRKADECRREAALTLNGHEKEALYKIADFWSKLAKLAAKEMRQSK
jgi:hypothetical protein